jgi:mutual gliding-motility protein MglA
MVFFNYSTMQMAAKVVYYGPGLCGKTTNLQYIYRKTSPTSRGEIVSLETETDRTLFFDLLPIDVGTISGFKARFQLYTVPGQVFYNSTRKLVLRGVDGLVFIADSQVPMLEANMESLLNLKQNLADQNLLIDEIPLVFQYNKRDLKNILSLDELNKALNPRNLPYYEAAAIYGKGVFETLKGISKITLVTIRRKAFQQAQLKKSTTVLSTPSTPVPQPAGNIPQSAVQEKVITQEKSSPSKATFISKQDLEKEKVEFAEVTNEKAQKSSVAVKKISLRSMEEIEKQLQMLREESTKPRTTPEEGKKFAEEAIQSLLKPATTAAEEEQVTKKIRIKIDGADLEKIKKLTIDLFLTGDAIRKNFSNALSVDLHGDPHNPKKVKLDLDIEIIKK